MSSVKKMVIGGQLLVTGGRVQAVTCEGDLVEDGVTTVTENGIGQSRGGPPGTAFNRRPTV